jgi:hypothetical protein
MIKNTTFVPQFFLKIQNGGWIKMAILFTHFLRCPNFFLNTLIYVQFCFYKLFIVVEKFKNVLLNLYSIVLFTNGKFLNRDVIFEAIL